MILLSVSLFAELKNEFITHSLVNSGMPIVDIRTTGEWRESGVLKNVIPIMFFDERGNYNVNAFLTQLNEKVDTSKPFALICRTGSRTSMVSAWLSKELKYSVINLRGGMEYATKSLHIQAFPYMK